MRQLLKKKNEGIWTEKHTQAFENLKQKITEIPCLAHYNSDYPNVITTDASTKDLGVTLWQEQPDGKLKQIGFASRFLSDTEKKYSINQLELLAVVWGLEHFRLYIYGQPIKLLTAHHALEPLIKRNRSNKTYSARLTRWLDRLAHFNINVHHIAGKHLALTDYLSRNPIMPPQIDDAYNEEYVINNILPHYNFNSKHGCLSNHTDQSEIRTEKSERKANNKPRTSDTHKRTAIDCLNADTLTRSYSRKQNYCQSIKITMDANTINEIEASNPTAETIELINRWREIVKPGIYRLTGGKWKRYHEPKFLRKERKVMEERLQQIIKKIAKQQILDKGSVPNKREASYPLPDTANNGLLIHSGTWTVQFRPKRAHKTDPDHRTKFTFKQHR